MKEPPDMTPFSGTGALDATRNARIGAAFEYVLYLRDPPITVKIRGYQPRRIILQERIQSQDSFPKKMLLNN
jgi:hypothetical protein